MVSSRTLQALPSEQQPQARRPGETALLPGLGGEKLARTLVTAGTAPDGTFWAGWLCAHALSHKIHVLVMGDLEARHGCAEDENTHRITNQPLDDVA